MSTNEELNEFRERFYAALSEQYQKFNDFEIRITSEITEYRKTVNSALSILSREVLDFQDRDIKERKRRQRRQDIKDILIAIVLICGTLVGCLVIAFLIYSLTKR